MQSPWVKAAGIALVVLCLYLLAISPTTLWDRDEPWYGRPAVEMLESGDYLVPRFNGEMWSDKPVLYYWFVAASIHLLGPTAFACRIWSPIGTALSCLLTFAIGKQLLNARVGLWAMIILATSLMVLGVGSMTLIEAVLLPILTATMLVFIHAVITRPRWWHAALMGGLMGLGMLAKGPMGLFPLPSMVLILFAGRRMGLSVRRHAWNILAALGIGAAIFLAWAIPVDRATNGEFLHAFFSYDVIGRTLHPLESHGGGFFRYLPYYLVVLGAGFFPWILCLPGALSAAAGNRLGGPRVRAVLLSWIVPIPIIMTLAATKLPHYILFIWPGLALATAALIVGTEPETRTPRDQRWLQWGGWPFAVVAFGAAGALIVGPWFVAIPGLRWWGLASGAVLAALGVLVLRHLHANRLQTCAGMLVAGMVLVQGMVFLGVLPSLEAIKVTPAIAAAITTKTARDVPVATYKFGEPSLNFYTDRAIEILRSEQAVLDWTQKPGPGVLVLPRSELEALTQRKGVIELEPLASRKGFNYSKGRPVELVALLRRERTE